MGTLRNRWKETNQRNHEQFKGLKVAALPYKDENFALIIYFPPDEFTYSWALPDIKHMTDSIIELIGPTLLCGDRPWTECSIIQGLEYLEYATIKLPKFTMKFELKLKEIVESLGAKDMWQRGWANFEGIFMLQKQV